MSHDVQSHSALGRIVNELEETAIAVILGLMTLITFINVVLRYGFNTGIIWGLEAVTINLFSSTTRRLLALFAALICIAYAGLLLKGAWDYWAPFAGLDATSGRWFPTGFENSRDQAWYETVDIPMPDWLRFIEPIMNEGETYGKLPRFIPYFMLPFGMALLLLRFIQAGARIFKGASTSLIVSHEAEDDIEAIKHLNAGN